MTEARLVDRAPDRRLARLVALDTSVRSTGVALIEPGRVVAETWIGPGESSAASLLPALDGLLKVAGWRRDSVEAVGVVVGPGSFTGLRIGVTTAKALAYAWQVPVIEVTGLEVLAVQAIGVTPACQLANGGWAPGAQQSALIVPVIPSRRGECYLQVFALPLVSASSSVRATTPSDFPQPLCEPRVVSFDDWAAGSWLPRLEEAPTGSTTVAAFLVGAASLTDELVRRWEGPQIQLCPVDQAIRPGVVGEVALARGNGQLPGAVGEGVTARAYKNAMEVVPLYLGRREGEQVWPPSQRLTLPPSQ